MDAQSVDSRAPVPWLIGARLLNMLVVLATIPLLIHALGRDGFAAWALLLAASVVFSALEFGMAPTYVRHAAAALHDRSTAGTRALLRRVLAIVVAAFALAALPLLWFAPELTALLRLPDTESLSASQLLPAIYLCVLLRALLQFGAHSFNAARRFQALALSTFAQSSLSNLAAALAAYATGRLDLSLAAFWMAQLTVVGCGFVFALRMLPSAPGSGATAPVAWRSLVAHGLKVQVDDWTQVVTFQFDKFLIAAMLGLPALTPYEVGNRCAQALRSIPSSGLDAFLAYAVIGRGGHGDAWSRYLDATRTAVLTVLVFLVAPMVVAPLFLFAWTGEVGLQARWVFLALAIAAAMNVIALPAAALVQAGGRAGLQARAAVVAMLLNLLLSYALIQIWGTTGAAIGTAVAASVGAALLIRAVHDHCAQSLASTLGMIFRYWPLAAVCLLCALLFQTAFAYWLSTPSAETHDARTLRWSAAALSLLGYLGCVFAILSLQLRRDASLRAQWRRWRSAFSRPMNERRDDD